MQDGAGRWTIPSDGAQALSEAGWAVDEAFPEIPNAGLRRELWTPTLHGRRRYPEGILELEARAVLKGVRRILMTRFGHDLRQLVLCDNLSIVLTIERFRSKNFVVLRVLRELAAYLFCRNVHLAIRWVPSELNISDEGSRLYDESGENKLLVDLLRDEWPEADGHGALSFAGRLKPTKYEPQTHKDPSFVSQRSGSESGGDSAESFGPCAERGPGTCGSRSQTEPKVGVGVGAGFEAKAFGKESGHCKAADQRLGGVPDRTGEKPKAGRRGDREWEHFVRVRGRENRRQRARLAKTTQTGAANLCGLPNGSSSGVPLASRGGGRFNEGEGHLQQEVEGVVGCGSRRRAGENVQPLVQGRRGQLHRRLHPGGSHRPFPSVRKTGEQENTPLNGGLCKIGESCAHLARGLLTPSRFGAPSAGGWSLAGIWQRLSSTSSRSRLTIGQELC